MKTESGSKKKNRYSFKTQAAQAKIKKILDLTKETPMCAPDLRKNVFLEYGQMRNYLKYLLEKKLIYICKYKIETHGGRTMQWAYYKAGDKKSKPKPKALTCAEKCRRYREIMKTDLERIDKNNAKRRLKRLKVKTDWTAQWIMPSSSSGQ